MALTPMMQQYMATKEKYRDCILFYRLGDFYEMFWDDAIVASRDMEVALTHKACGEPEDAPMCGVPYHAADIYIAKLIEKGHKVAIAEQMTDPALSKGLVEREVIKVITPGTVTSQNMLNEKDNNYLMSVYVCEEGLAMAWADITTGEFRAMQAPGSDRYSVLFEQLVKIKPSEIITNLSEEEYPELWDQAKLVDKIFISVPTSDVFSDRSCSAAIKAHFRTAAEKSAGLDPQDVPLLFKAVGSLLSYLRATQMRDLSHLAPLAVSDRSAYMSLDKATIRNLEITETLFDGKIQGSLLGVLDRCGTAMGSRMMKQWLRQPLNRKADIDLRLDAVERLEGDVFVRNDLREALKAVYDLERLCGRISMGTANAKDMLALKISLSMIPDIKAGLKAAGGELLESLNADIDDFSAIRDEIERSIREDAPFTIREGGLIKDSYSAELDELKYNSRDARQWIAGLEAKEKERTGIKNLKVGFNKVFGYYIEISKSYTGAVPENYIRKQTLVSGERYITEELKNYENLVLNAQTKINELEYRLFSRLREKIEERIPDLQRAAGAIAAADVLSSFAESSAKLNYTKPEITDDRAITITKGRHPVIENSVREGVFVSNDVYIDCGDSSMLLITGPNMSGKSTYMRQLALIVLMAQAGCFVPADSAVIGCCDRIYTRIGASDNLALGQSTFFVEMSELAYILNTATEKSLIILDEIGRGTSTYDGLSIAWAVVEYLTDEKHRIRTLFATHYHELTELAGKVRGLTNLNVDIAEKDGNIIFLHKIIPGSASRSYGIHVARLAGVPENVLGSAEEKLALLESEKAAETAVSGSLKTASPEKTVEAAKADADRPAPQEQLSLFSFNDSVLAEKVRNLDLMNITPSQAIAVLEELQKLVER